MTDKKEWFEFNILGRASCGRSSCALLSSKDSEMVGVKDGDVIAIRGKRTTAAVVDISKSDIDGRLQVNEIVMRNAGVKEGDKVSVRKIEPVPAKEVEVHVTTINFRSVTSENVNVMIRRALLGVPVVKGDVIPLYLKSGVRILVLVKKTEPDAAVRIMKDTNIDIEFMDRRYMPDTSAVIDGSFREFVEENTVWEVIIPRPVLDEIEHQVNRGLATGRAGMAEIKKIRGLCEERGIALRICEVDVGFEAIKNAHSGAIDRIIRRCAMEAMTTLITGDRIQKEMAEIEGIPVIYRHRKKKPHMRIEEFFGENVMSVHIKAGVGVFTKRGTPGHFEMLTLQDGIDEREVENIAQDIIERAKRDNESFVEMEKKGATVVQMREYRIVITRLPFSDTLEITAVKPIVKLSLEDYRISDKLRKRIEERAEGILVAGAPGAGKSTFVQAIAEYYSSLRKIVKTMEKPRDLNLTDEITQYTALEGDMANTGDILLLVRPDYTIFDEMRTTDDFKVFTDLRLAGVGMVGVVHATRAIDALQRFIGRVELGVIPQIVDTIIHIEAGAVSKVLTLSYVVKVPSGMREEDLARPVIEVRDLETEKLLYEVYSFGEQVVVVPVSEESPGVYRLAEREIEREIKKMYPGIRVRAKVTGTGSATIYVNSSSIPALIGKGGRNIERLERYLGISLSVEEMGHAGPEGDKIKVEVVLKKKTIQMFVGEKYAHRKVAIVADSETLFYALVSAEGKIKMRKSTANGKALMHYLKEGVPIYAVPV